MREIMFRGKRIENGEWLYGYYVHIGPVSCQIACIIPEYASAVYAIEVDHTTVGKYTGLLDKNGKRIFEGDICRNTRTNEIVSVHWHGSMAGFVWNQKRDDSEYQYDFGALFRSYDKYEVIGNIYDNPELLEED